MPIGIQYPQYNWLPHVRFAVNEIRTKFNIAVVGTYPGHQPTMSRAADFMTGSKAKHDAILAYVMANAKRLGIMYIITWRRIWSVQRSSEGIRHYTLSNPHVDHVHISFETTGGSGNAPATDTPAANTSTDPISVLGARIAELEKVAKSFSAFAGMIGNPHNWLRILEIILGLIMIGIALGRSNPDALTTVQKAGKQVASLAKS